jgi:PPP family 3-phenylpropionic acid transporter
VSPLVAVSAFYGLLFGGLGLVWPSYGPFLSGLGLGPAEAAFIMALNPLMGALAPPLVGLIADARRASVWALRVLSALTAVAFAGWLFEPRARVAIYVTAGLYALARAPITSLTDATAFDVALHHGTSFGRLRLWGSLGFLLAAPLGGALLEHGSPRLMVAVATGVLVAAAACTTWLPAPPLRRQHGTLRAWLELCGRPAHRLYLLAVFLAYAGGGALDGCFSLHLARLGHGGTYIGVAWMLGVFSEVVLMRHSADLIAAVGPVRLLAAAQLCAALRWALIAFVTHPVLLLAQQPLHGITFGLTFVAAATLARAEAPAQAPAASQGLFTAVAAAGSLIGMTGGGQLLELSGGRATFLAALACALGAAAVAGRLAVVSPGLGTARAVAPAA